MQGDMVVDATPIRKPTSYADVERGVEGQHAPHDPNRLFAGSRHRVCQKAEQTLLPHHEGAEESARLRIVRFFQMPQGTEAKQIRRFIGKAPKQFGGEGVLLELIHRPVHVLIDDLLIDCHAR